MSLVSDLVSLAFDWHMNELYDEIGSWAVATPAPLLKEKFECILEQFFCVKSNIEEAKYSISEQGVDFFKENLDLFKKDLDPLVEKIVNLISQFQEFEVQERQERATHKDLLKHGLL